MEHMGPSIPVSSLFCHVHVAYTYVPKSPVVPAQCRRHYGHYNRFYLLTYDVCERHIQTDRPQVESICC